MTLARRVMMVLREAAGIIYDPALWTWGANSSGQLGQSDTADRSSPVQVGSLTTWSEVSVGNAFTLALKTDGTLWAWGINTNGRLGLGDTASRSSPIQVGSLTTWTDISAGSSHVLALQSNGTLWAWGAGSAGGLGQGTSAVDRSSPIQVGSLTTWVSVSAGRLFSLALQSNGTLWAWGEGSTGQLGQGTSAVDRSSPVQVGSLTTWTNIAAGVYHALALQSNGTLWAWGEGSTGQLGQGTSAVDRSSPVQVGSLTTWTNIAGGFDVSVGIRSDGTLWTWGEGSTGQLGQGTSAVDRSSPVQVGSLTTWTSARAAAHVLALQSNGTLWAWGANTFGRLGDGTTTHRSSPVQVGSLTTWTKAAGYLNSAALR